MLEPIIGPLENVQQFKNEPAFEGVRPLDPEHRGRFAVLLEPVKANQIAHYASISGVCVARVNVLAEWHPRADISHDDPSCLASCRTGSARILWKQPGLGTNLTSSPLPSETSGQSSPQPSDESSEGQPSPSSIQPSSDQASGTPSSPGGSQPSDPGPSQTSGGQSSSDGSQTNGEESSAGDGSAPSGNPSDSAGSATSGQTSNETGGSP